MNVIEQRRKKRMGRVGIWANVLLFAIKLWAAVLTGSAAIVSDALNAFLDVLAYTAAYASMRVHDARADHNHPFGHRRAEPLAGLLFAVIASVLGATIVKDSIVGLFAPGDVRHSPLAVGLIAIGIATKGVMALWYRRGWKKHRSAALRASYVDSRNDVLASVAALAGFAYGGVTDDVAAIFIGAWIIFSGVQVGLENVGYLMGKAPDDAVLRSVRRAAMAVPGVVGVNDLKAHYVGDRIHLELHIEIPKGTSLKKSHDIGVEVRRTLEGRGDIEHAFIHIDPV